MKTPEFLRFEYMTWKGKAMVIAGLVMLLALVFIIGLWKGYSLSEAELLACHTALNLGKVGLIK